MLKKISRLHISASVSIPWYEILMYTFNKRYTHTFIFYYAKKNNICKRILSFHSMMPVRWAVVPSLLFWFKMEYTALQPLIETHMACSHVGLRNIECYLAYVLWASVFNRAETFNWQMKISCCWTHCKEGQQLGNSWHWQGSIGRLSWAVLNLWKIPT